MDHFAEDPFSPPRWKVALILALVVLGLASVVVGVLHGKVLRSWLAGETDLWGDFAYSPPHDVEPQQLQRSQLATVHRQLLPAWTIAMGSSPERGKAAFSRLRAVVLDPNLRQLLDEMNRLTAEHAGRHSKRLFYLVRAWNAYLDQNAQPWRLDGAVRTRPHPFLYLKVYRVEVSLQVRVGDRAHRARLLRRVDGTNVVELYLGSASHHQDGAMVVLDRILEFATDEVWPLLAPGPDADRAGRLEARVRLEAGRALPASTLALLGRLAAARRVLVQGKDQINRQRRCGSRFVVNGVSLDGFPARHEALLRRVALRDQGRACPALSVARADEMIAASQQLKTAGVRQAVGALGAWVARGVTVHEIRHVADDQQVHLERRAPACAACPAQLGRAGRAELSAYLASFAAPDLGYLNLYQACNALKQSSGGANHGAIRVAVRALGDACDTSKGPPQKLYRRAAALERRYFGRSEPITLPADFPATLALK